jgi:dTDP-4-dehydrorhamnose 3,5-epimerase-like enzyme
MKIETTQFPDVKIITPIRHGDARGFLSEVYNKRALADVGCLYVSWIALSNKTTRTNKNGTGAAWRDH